MTTGPDPSKFPTLHYEQILWKAGFTCIAGIDEAGRGAWAGPVCAAAVILPPDPSLTCALNGVRDSKLMTPLSRENWAPRIMATSLAWGIGFASSQEIDALGIVPATKLAAIRALSALSTVPDHPIPNPLHSAPLIPDYPLIDNLPPNHLVPDFLLTDYLLLPNLNLPQTALIKGDRFSLSVASASVLAKTARDAQMRSFDTSYPGYSFSRHKGYGTLIHKLAIQRLGLCAIHRLSFSITY